METLFNLALLSLEIDVYFDLNSFYCIDNDIKQIQNHILYRKTQVGFHEKFQNGYGCLVGTAGDGLTQPYQNHIQV